jgi:PAS domain S-box-containing protein
MTQPLRPELEVAALSGEVTAVMRGIVHRLMQLPHADGASLSTIDDDIATFAVSAGSDLPLEGRRIPLDQTLGALCIAKGDVTVLRDDNADLARSLTPGAATVVLAPLAWDGEVRGILAVRSASAGAFDEAHVEEIRMLSAGASIALRNAEVIELLAASERKYRELHAHAADAIIVTNATGEILDANDAAAAMLWRPVGELVGMNARELFAAEEPEAQPPPTDELKRDKEVRAERPFLRKDGTEVMVEYSSRVLSDGRVHTSLRDVTQRRRNEERLRTSLGRLHAIVQTQQEISALELDPEAFTSTLVERAQRLAGADGAAVQWFEGDHSVYRHCSGVAAPHVGLRLDRGRSLSGVAALRGEAVYAADCATDPRVDTSATARIGIRSLICAPLYRDGRVSGILSVVAREPDAFDELAIESTRLMAEFVSTVMRNANELEERRRLVEELRTQEQVVEHMQTGLWVWRADGDTLRLESGNRASVQAIGLELDEVIGATIEEVLPAAPRETRDRLMSVIETGEVYEGGDVAYQDDRIEPNVFSLKAFPLSGRRVAVTFENITERVRANLLFESTFERSVVPKLVVDDARRVVGLNSACAELLALSRDEALGLTVDELFANDPVADLWPKFLEAGTMEAETWLHLADGARRRIDFVATANVQPGRHIAVVRDLTRQKDLESQLRQAQKMEAVGRLAGGIAHDFNNLLTAITGYSEFLIAGDLDERMRRHAQEINKAAARAAALTGQLLAFSRRQVLQPRVLDLNAAVTDMDMMLRRLIGEDVELVTMLDPNLPSVRADPTQVEQVIVNLAVNARDAMPHGGSVTIETASLAMDDDLWVELRLTDTGIGMTEIERQQLFDPFFTTKEGGTGLGLATVYGIVEQSGGTIEVDSAPGLGSSFRILLPAVGLSVEEPEPAPAREGARASGAETIVLVEDETVVRQLVAEILESSGYAVLPAADGPSALELIRRSTGEIDLLISDVVMPGMSGPEVAAAVTAMRPGTQVLYISGYTDSQIGHHGVLEEGIAFLQKPFSADDLTRKVREVLDGVVAGVD